MFSDFSFGRHNLFCFYSNSTGDNEAPVVAVCPESTSVTVPFQSTGTTVSWNEPTVTDNSGAFTTTQTRESGTFFNSGTQTQVTYTFTDAANNQAFCTFTVTVVPLGWYFENLLISFSWIYYVLMFMVLYP